MKTSYYTINGPRYKIALVCDLHERKCNEIIDILKREQPDFIVCPGDMFERNDIGVDQRSKKDYSYLSHTIHAIIHVFNNLLFSLFQNEGNPTSENTYAFFKECESIAPVFYSLGNHEYYLSEEDRSFLKEHNVTLLDNSYVKYNDIYIGGLSPNVSFSFIDEFENLSGYKLLLNHHPEYFEKYLKNRRINCIVSGHAHGGQIRIFNRGIFAPNQGLFPRFTRGKIHNMIISSGTSNTAAIPRWNNPCEVVIIEMVEGEEYGNK